MRVLLALLSFTIAVDAYAECAGPRWPVKVATDPDAGSISTVALPTTIPLLRSFPMTRPLPQDRRVRPAETTTYSITATLTEYRFDDDGDAYLILADAEGRTITAEIPSVECARDSRFSIEITAARLTFDARFAASSEFQRAMVPVEIRGVAFFDFVSGQRGMAPNGLTIHPVTSIDFTPLAPPPPPKWSSRRRAVAPRLPVCSVPTLTLSATKSNICSGESVTLSWHASDSASRVTIDGVGVALPSSGSATVQGNASAAYSARASNSCGVSHEAVAVVTVRGGSFASLSGPGSLQRGASANLSCSVSAVASWSLASALRNSISPSSGTQSGSFTSRYTANSAGTDTVTLTTNGDCGPLTRTISIFISEPQNMGLLCCDGTRSPTCFSCANKQGCCSGHKGVCGC